MNFPYHDLELLKLLHLMCQVIISITDTVSIHFSHEEKHSVLLFKLGFTCPKQHTYEMNFPFHGFKHLLKLLSCLWFCDYFYVTGNEHLLYSKWTLTADVSVMAVWVWLLLLQIMLIVHPFPIYFWCNKFSVTSQWHITKSQQLKFRGREKRK